MKTTCTVIVFNFNSIGFLRLCIKQIMKMQHPEIDVSVIIADQSNDEQEKKMVHEEFSGYADVTIVHMAALRSGFAVDWVFRNMDIKSEYTCTLDCDAFPLSHTWLYLPITLMQENPFSFVGGLFFESRKEEIVHCYHNNPFYCMSMCYRVGRTETYKELAMEGGFTVFHARKDLDFVYGKGHEAWAAWAADDYEHKGSDDGTIAHFYDDNFTENNKMALATSHTMGDSKIESGYGGIVDDLVLHFGFCHWSTGIEDRVAKDYAYWKKRINDGDENVLEEMLKVAYANPSDIFHEQGTHVRSVWNGTLKKSFPSTSELNKRIEELKKV